MTESTHSSTTRLRRMLWLPALFVLTALLPLGGTPAAAEHPADYGFQWGPVRPLGALGAPLTSSAVQNALYLSVDEDAVSTRVLGEPSLLMEVGDATYPSEYFPDVNLFEPVKAKMVLEQSGIDTLALTIAPDPAVPEAPKLAEAIAEELRKNLDAQVTVVQGEADLLVTRSLGRSPSAAPGALSLQVACSPDTFRPDEWAVVECVGQLTNRGETALIPHVAFVADSGPSADVIFSELNGELEPSTGWSQFAAANLAAGETAMGRTWMLVRMPEGTTEFSARVIVGREVVASVPLRLTASPAAELPPRDLEVKRELIEESVDGRYPRASYKTTITNLGSKPISSLELTDRLDWGTDVVDSEPPPANQDFSARLVSWELSSFGKESLLPGESLVLQTTYGSADEAPCLSPRVNGLAETTAGSDIQRYAALLPLTSCGSQGGRGGGDDAGAAAVPSALGHDGDGPAGDAFDIAWAAAFLAAAGAGLVATALLARRRLRP